MKKGFLFLFMSALICFSFLSCKENSQNLNSSDEEVKNKVFSFHCYNLKIDQTFNTPYENNLSLEICNMVSLQLAIPDQKWQAGEDNLNLITTEYDPDFIYFSYSSSNDFLKCITFQFMALDTFDHKEIKITFDGQEYILGIEAIDFHFFENKKPTTEELSSTYPEFKEMMDSICYHDYVTPYPGISSYGGSTYWQEYTYTYSFSEAYDLDYLPYLKDSVYYPSQMNLGYPNIAARTMTMTFNDPSIVKANTVSTTMADFSVGYGVVDPDCTSPENPLWNIEFHAVPLHYSTSSTLTNKKLNQYLHETYYLLSKKYSENFLQYQVNDLTIQVIKIGNSLLGYFEDENYAYMLYASYQFD